MFPLKCVLDLNPVEKGLSYNGPGIPRIEQREAERACARLFATEDGQKVMAWLQMTTFQRAANASATEGQLRHMEGQRALVSTILRLIDRGRAG